MLHVHTHAAQLFPNKANINSCPNVKVIKNIVAIISMSLDFATKNS